ncbi:Hpt domain-containing protein [Sulfurovum sp.]|uniref:Hpt domain-containing protein n=1 Tax=Sulfurovum sp. TaxID=1969726 RepID=UPI002867E34D|nr:Hpt domain-containing protein [Sulfurovum sp.]
MLASTILYVFVFLIFLVIFIEYINDKRYQDKRREERQKTTPKKPTEPTKEIPEEEKIPQEEPEPQIEEIPEVESEEVIEEVQPEVVEVVQPEPEPEVEPEPEAIIEEIQAEVIEEEITETKELPECKYPPFTHVRLVEMGLSEDEATEFVNELIPQLEEQIPLIEAAMSISDYQQVERLTHGIKGSATNLGTGGISDLLVEYNSYLKSGTDPDIVKAYHAHFIHYIDKLKKQYT